MSSLKKRLAASGAAIISVEAFNHAFDYVLFPAVLLYFGTARGWVVMTLLAMVLNYIMIRIYTKSKYDWYGFEYLRLQAEKQGRGWKGYFIRLGKVSAFILLSWEDPFKAYIFARGKRYAGYSFSAADWATFFGANLIGTAIWTGMLGGVIAIVKRVIFG